MQTAYTSGSRGITKILTVIIGCVTLGITAYASNRVWKEELFLGIIVTCLIISILYLLAHIFVKDLEINSTNKAFDSGFHFLAGLFLLGASSIFLYSGVELRQDIEYLCSGGIDRGIPCLFDRRRGNWGVGGGISNVDILPIPIAPDPNDYGPSGYARLGNGLIDGRSFFSSANWLTWIKSSRAHFFEKCYDILPRLIHCNRYFELKIAAGVIGLINGILYGIVGILVLAN